MTKELRLIHQLNKNVAVFRAQIGISQEQFGKIFGTTQAHISQIENGVCLPGTELLLKMAEQTPTLNMNWLFRGNQQPFIKAEGNDDKGGDTIDLFSQSTEPSNDIRYLVNQMKRQMEKLEELHAFVDMMDDKIESISERLPNKKSSGQ